MRGQGPDGTCSCKADLNLEQKEATCYSSDPSPITSFLDPQSRASAVTSESGVLKNEPWKSRYTPLELVENMMQQTYTNYLIVKFMLQKNFQIYFFF